MTRRSYLNEFCTFHSTNPHVYERLVEYARQVQRAGYTSYGIGALWERLRWYFDIETADPNSAFKLNNNYRAYYARLLMLEPGLSGLFHLRTSAADENF
jgi:hypothetical protein